MIGLHNNMLSIFSQSMPLAGQEPDPVAQRGVARPGLAVPHDPVSGVRIKPAVAIAAEMGDRPHGIAKPFRHRQAVFVRMVAQEIES